MVAVGTLTCCPAPQDCLFCCQPLYIQLVVHSQLALGYVLGTLWLAFSSVVLLGSEADFGSHSVYIGSLQALM
jgi:hypothetical protein